MDKLIITYYESIDELYEAAYDSVVGEGYSEEEHGEEYFDELLNDALDNLAYEEMDEVFDADDLEHWWRRNGWTLDRGYGGPNYKERVADETDWDLLWDYINNVFVENPSFGYPTMTPTEINDLVIFWEDDEEGY